MTRFGDLFDQDGDLPVHAGPGRLFDQDASTPNSNSRHRAAERQRQVELRRAELERFRTPAGRTVPVERAPLVISSRPGPPPPLPPLPTRQSRDGKGVSSTERATAILAAGTFLSRLSGFARVLVIGYVLGIGSLSDAYNYANGIPNIIYDLLVGGILSATLVPVFVDLLRSEDREEGTRAVSAVLSAVSVALVAVSALLWLLSAWVIRFYLLLSPASIGSPERALATSFLHFFAPQVFFLGAIVVTTALLNARRSFSAPAFSPILNNVIVIVALLATKAIASQVLSTRSSSPASTLTHFQHDERAVWVLGIGTTLGYAAQLLVQLPAMRTAGIRVKAVWDLRHPAVRRVASLSSWLVGVVIANQLSLALVMVLAGRTQGGVTAYQFSYQFFQLPYALIAVSIATALMPDLAERWSTGDRSGFESRAVTGLRVTLATLLPAGVAYVVVAQPFVQLAIEHGRVTGTGAHLVGSTLALFAVGLPGFSAFFLLMRMYQAMQDTKTMFLIYAFENGLTLALAPVFGALLGVPGLALAWVAPYTIASVVAVVDLRRKVGTLGGSATMRALVRICVAAGITAGAVFAVGLVFPSHSNSAVVLGRLVIQLGVGAGVYLLLAKAMRITELGPLFRISRQVLGLRT